jgi:hypothetical protein
MTQLELTGWQKAVTGPGCVICGGPEACALRHERLLLG